ncbi:hypothetical protein LJC31_06675, partial [Synergistaceae bacterium OttesenSCG-928-I11]|nr:hypothetical protein [Synergistaceae bacterium OttesenSCG-928-I11]
MALLAQNVNLGTGTTLHYKLVDDIDLNNMEWTPIGTALSTTAFKGTFDGNGHTIRGLKIFFGNEGAPYGYDVAGLFGVVDGGTVKNVGIINCNIDIGSSNLGLLTVGALAGMVNDGIVQNVYVTGTIMMYPYGSSTTSVGGLIGTATNTEISQSAANASVTAGATSSTSDHTPVGGLVGVMSSGTLTDSYAAGTVAASRPWNASNPILAYAGGLVGAVEDVKIDRCHATTRVSASFSNPNELSAESIFGGLVGTATLDGSAHGIENSYAAGSVSDTSEGGSNGAKLGGLIGALDIGNGATLKNSYAYNDGIYSPSTPGGLIGTLSSSGTFNESDIANCYWRSDLATAGIADVGSLTIDQSTRAKGLTKTEFLSSAAFTGWGFADTWCYTSMDNGDRPHLQAFFGADTNTLNLDTIGLSRNRNIRLVPGESISVDLVAIPMFSLTDASFAEAEVATSNLEYIINNRTITISAPSDAVNWTYDYDLRLAAGGAPSYTTIPLTIEVYGGNPAPDYFTSADILAVSATTNGVKRDAVSEDATTWMLEIATTDTSLSSVPVSFDIYEGATVSPDSPLDFSGGPVAVIATAPDGVTQKTYTLKAEQLSNSTAISGITVTTNADNETYSVTENTPGAWGVSLPNTRLDSVSVDITLSDDKATINPTDLSNIDLSTPLSFTVTAEDGTVASHTLTAVPLSNATAPTSIAVSADAIERSANSPLASSPDHYQLVLPYGTPLNAVYYSFTLPQGAMLDAPPEMPLDFSAGLPQGFRVLAEDGITSADYYLLVVNAPSNIATANGFSVTLDGTVYAAELQSGNSYLITLPLGTDLTAVNLDIALPDGATVQPAGPIDFSNGPVTITVTAQDGTTTMTYTLEIRTKAPVTSGDVVAEFYVRNVPLAPMKAGESADVYIEWKGMTDSLSPDKPARSRDVYPDPMPVVSWDILPPEGGGNWNVIVSADPDNPFSAHLSVIAGGAQSGRERYRVVVHMKQSKGDETLYEETYSRGFYVGDPFPVVVVLSPSAQDEIDRVNAILARSDVEIIPGNHQETIPAHILDLLTEHLRNYLVTYASRSNGDGCGEQFTATRAGYAPNRTSFEFTTTAVSDDETLEMFILEDIETIRMAEKEPEPEALPECFDCTDKFSANIELDLTKLPASADGKIVMVPMSYTVTIQSDDMNDFYDPGRAWDIIENPVAHLDDIFDVLVLHKRIHEGAMEGWYTRLVRGVAQPQEAYDAGMLKVWSDKTERSLTITLGYYVINYHGESFVVKGPRNEAVSGDEIGYIILPDGLRNDTLIDPLWTNVWRGEGGTGSSSGGGGGCAAGAGVAVAIAALALLPLVRR